MEAAVPYEPCHWGLRRSSQWGHGTCEGCADMSGADGDDDGHDVDDDDDDDGHDVDDDDDDDDDDGDDDDGDDDDDDDAEDTYD